ncbi:MAG: ABC transporter ATP-binding protein [Actinobacteria bacterium]|nr:ABC transporter ATP-binding protein [Actinomycetota bacterium]
MTKKVHEHELEHVYSRENPVRTLWYLYENQKTNLALAFLFFSIKHAPAWVLPLATANIIDVLVYKQPIENLIFNAGLLFVIVLQNFPVNLLYVRYLAFAIRNVEYRLRSALVERMQQLTMGFYLRTNAGALQTKVIRDVENIEGMVRHGADGGFAAINSLLGAVVITAIRIPEFLPFLLFVGPITAIVIIRLRKTMNDRNEEFRGEIEEMSARVNEMTTLIPITRAHGLEQSALRQMHDSFSNVKRAGLKLDAFNAKFQAAAWVIFQIANVSCLVIAAWCAYNSYFNVSTGDVVLLSAYFGQLIGSVILLSSLAPFISKGLASVRSLGEVLESPDIEVNSGKKKVSSVQGNIEFKEVSLMYPGASTWALSQINVKAGPGKVTALVGASGSGKSTFINLVIGFLRPSKGQFLLDHQNMSELDMREVRKYVSMVPQESVLFDGSVRDNVTYGISDVSESKFIQALKDANAWEFVSQLPDGQDTIVGERGARISGGQKQRLAIARALIRNPRILILDEATSALDSESENLIQQALAHLMKDRTTFVVAHRLSTIMRADEIIVLDQGVLVERGTHTDLLAKKGVYFRLFSAQSSFITA